MSELTLVSRGCTNEATLKYQSYAMRVFIESETVHHILVEKRCFSSAATSVS